MNNNNLICAGNFTFNNNELAATARKPKQVGYHRSVKTDRTQSTQVCAPTSAEIKQLRTRHQQEVADGLHNVGADELRTEDDVISDWGSESEDPKVPEEATNVKIPNSLIATIIKSKTLPKASLIELQKCIESSSKNQSKAAAAKTTIKPPTPKTLQQTSAKTPLNTAKSNDPKSTAAKTTIKPPTPARTTKVASKTTYVNKNESILEESEKEEEPSTKGNGKTKKK